MDQEGGSMAIKQEDPAPSRLYVGKVNWAEAVKIAAEHPQTWYLVGEFSPGMAQHLRQGGNKAFLLGTEPKDPVRFMRSNWEIAARVARTGEQRVNIYIRKIGK
jgi:hypothetical protein